jgi:hypothetical protein
MLTPTIACFAGVAGKGKGKRLLFEYIIDRHHRKLFLQSFDIVYNHYS